MVIEGRKTLLLVYSAAAIVGLFTTNLIAMVLWMIAAIRLLQKDKTDVNENATAQLRQNHSKGQSDWNHQQNQQQKDAWDPEQEINNKQKGRSIYILIGLD